MAHSATLVTAFGPPSPSLRCPVYVRAQVGFEDSQETIVVLVVLGLPASTTVFVRVAAVTAVGAGPFSQRSSPVRTLAATPPTSPPLASLSDMGPDSGQASWLPPTDLGGLPLLHYTLDVWAPVAAHAFEVHVGVDSIRCDGGSLPLFSSLPAARYIVGHLFLATAHAMLLAHAFASLIYSCDIVTQWRSSGSLSFACDVIHHFSRTAWLAPVASLIPCTSVFLAALELPSAWRFAATCRVRP